MTRVLGLGVALLCAGALAAPVGAQDKRPTELWSEYPLVQKVERVQPTSSGPFLPPSRDETVSPPAESTRWSLWLAVSLGGALLVLVAARAAVPVASSGARVVGEGTRRLRGLARPRPRARAPKPMQLREHPGHPRAPARGRRVQYAPLPPVAVAEPDVEREPRRSVMRRTGFLRSRFVVVSDEPGGKVRRIGRSKSFWRVGSVAQRERAAEDAWSELVNDLRIHGLEPDPTRTSDFYVLLRRVDTAPSPILPTIEAYTHGSDAAGDA